MSSDHGHDFIHKHGISYRELRRIARLKVRCWTVHDCSGPDHNGYGEPVARSQLIELSDGQIWVLIEPCGHDVHDDGKFEEPTLLNIREFERIELWAEADT